MPTVLESLLEPIGRDEFRDRYYGRQPLLIRGDPKKFAGLFAWDDLNRLLNSSPWPHPQVQVLPGNGYATKPDAILEQCRAGASLIFKRIHEFDPNIGELTRALEAETGEPMNVNMYLSQPAKAALPLHFDRHDVFVLQIDGHKAWSVYESTVAKPIFVMAEGLHQPPREPAFQCELAPGDVLYIPRGHWHQALAQRGLSLHLTLGINARTGIDFLNWLVDELRSDPRFRHELPLSFADDGSEVRERRLREHVNALGEMLLSRLNDRETVPAFSAYCAIADRDVRQFKLPAQLFEAPLARLDVRWFSRPARQRWILENGPTADLIALSVWGNVFHFPRSARVLVEYVFSQTSFAYEDALSHAGGLTEQGVREVLDPLLREGILDAAP